MLFEAKFILVITLRNTLQTEKDNKVSAFYHESIGDISTCKIIPNCYIIRKCFVQNIPPKYFCLLHAVVT